MKWYKKLHWQIILGLILGLIWGLVSALAGFNEFTLDFIKPFGTIFITLLKLIAVPLVLASLVAGVTSLNDTASLSRMGGKTVIIYLCTTVFAITIGLVSVNVWEPGKALPEETKIELQETYRDNVGEKEEDAMKVKERRPLDFIVGIAPDNFFKSASENSNMLQIVFVAILLGIGIIKVGGEKGQLLVNVFDSFNDVIIKIVDLIMKTAPYGVFALMAALIVDLAGDDLGKAGDLLYALGAYCLVVVSALILHVLLVYTAMFKIFTKVSLGTFFKAIRPAMLLGFSTSSSSATLPVTMERVEKNLGVEEEVSSFVLPIGATINMDGTSLYQAVAAVFIAQALGMDLTIIQQLTIVLTATLASIGAAGVPGAGIVMLVVVLQSINVPVEGIALILGVDRILDMCRTTVNITGDAAVALTVASTEGKLGTPNLDD
ncbi:MAG TPA: dicarboxylate/amino acid:cation symporter [Balneola sp.]|jgi:Na+/H+-dicarboxylate symporter|nr:dicarboxylate/amino acid:cation symporter [Bacteroidota bacterium]MAC06166.1 dicarboxylate/amino acid:cation symporter [Balneola sp.]MAO78522.1 dicarboxylate/amino acid:cation symporter [Balneola sp.]MBF64887.1 dicarboxylate/amino acid:cation symporter [Balneola sp.]HAH50710.1 dicarboxylate/amino acid:cation symporter [Balneola sp.]|tara:strand:+ start:4361 stop:5662 length:1302 start_codon:yes stop_codon:yes gene_type:complete